MGRENKRLAPDELHDFSGETGPSSGRILYCVHCLAAGKKYTTHCPGFFVGVKTNAAICRGELNYKNGQWIWKDGRVWVHENVIEWEQQ